MMTLRNYHHKLASVGGDSRRVMVFMHMKGFCVCNATHHVVFT
jgi:hypothetical protein